jgi:hypothetical protein
MNDNTDTAAVAHPAPPIPRDVDLRDFRFMPLDVVQLQNSETWAMADGWTAKALVNLWTRAWHQVPAGSLPDEDSLHRTWAGVPDWESVRGRSRPLAAVGRRDAALVQSRCVIQRNSGTRR